MGALGATLPMFAPNRYDPIVAASWPQNQLSHAGPLVPGQCGGCHAQTGGAGRFPHLSSELNGGYCLTILAQAVQSTMPPFAPGSEANSQAVIDFRNWCGTPASAGPSNRGDPHLTTTNGIDYDFQAAGEFNSLRNSDTGFELQTRQTPVSTSFVPGANPHTGLASCVALNTAAALRVGKRRITYQPGRRASASPENMQLRIDGRPVSLPAAGVNLGGGNLIARAEEGGGIDIKLADKTRVIITPNFWASQGYWYLNVEVVNTPAREGTMGHIPAGNWLPLAPNGASFGPRPVPLAARHLMLNGSFADAWRVTNATSLFDYAPGTSTKSFTDRNWPPFAAPSCPATVGPQGTPGPVPPPVRRPIKRETAERLCRPVKDDAAFKNCVFDVMAMGDPDVAKAYQLTLKLKNNAM